MVVGIFVALFLLWKLQVVVFIFFISFILSSALRPLVEKLKKRGIPKMLSIVIIYSLVFAFLSFVIYITGVAVADQVSNLANNANNIITDTIVRLIETFPSLREVLQIEANENLREAVQVEVDEFLNKGVFSSFNFQIIGGASGAILTTITNVTGIIFGLFTVLIVSAYMTKSESKFYEGMLLILPKPDRKRVEKIIEKVESKLGSWLIGQLALMAIVGIATYIGLSLPGIFFSGSVVGRYAVPIGLIAGIFEALPNIGPTLTSVIAIIIVVGSDGSLLEIGYVVALSLIIQQLEAVFVVPAVMKKAIGIDPIVTILGLIAATTLFGVIGAVLVLPMIAIGQLVIEELFHYTRSKK